MQGKEWFKPYEIQSTPLTKEFSYFSVTAQRTDKDTAAVHFLFHWLPDMDAYTIETELECVNGWIDVMYKLNVLEDARLVEKMRTINGRPCRFFELHADGSWKRFA